MPERQASTKTEQGPPDPRRDAFLRRCDELNLAVDPRLIWYHTIDLGAGLVTPGTFDLRPHLDTYRLPTDLSGQRVLDIGPGSGFFSVEFHRRNADLTALELPSVAALDQLPGRTQANLVQAARRFLPLDSAGDAGELDIPLLDWLILDGPFQFCCRVLDTPIERRRGTIYQVADQTLGLGRFDLIFLGDVLLHVMDPVRALASAAAVCDGTLIIAQPVPDDLANAPAARWRGGDDPEMDCYEWWLPNLAWYRQLLRKLGFRSIEVVGRFDAEMLASGQSAERTIIHAKR